MTGIKKARHSEVIALMAFFVVVTLFLGLELLEKERFSEAQQTKVMNTLGQIRANLESEVNANFYLTRGLIAYISIHQNIDENTFSQLAQQLLKHHNYIRNIAIAKEQLSSSFTLSKAMSGPSVSIIVKIAHNGQR